MKCLLSSKTSAPSGAPSSPSTVPQVPPSQQSSTSVTSTAETEIYPDIDLELRSRSPDDSDATNEFNHCYHITESFVRQTGEEEDDDDGNGRMPSVILIEIAKLFNFTNKSWIPSHASET